MNIQSRTGRALRNTAVTALCHMGYLLTGIVCRTVFSHTLGTEYLGVNSLFSNILTILSFAELGIGSALVYRLYAPFANHEQNTVRQYIDLYRRVYRVIIAVIAVCGFAVIPFLDYLVKAPNVKESLPLLYVLYLAHTLVSYVLVYKKSLLIADQNDHIVSIITDGCNILADIVRCVLLVTTHNFVLYCLVGIAAGLSGNVICSLYADRRYAFLRQPAVGKLDTEAIDCLKTDAKGLMLTKIARTAFSGTDNLFISVFLGIRYVGILSNYTLLLATVNTLMNKIFGSITAIIGNLAVEKGSEESTEAVLKRLFFLNTCLYGYLCVGMILLLREFMTEIWLTKEYLLSQSIVTVAVMELFLRSIHYPIYTTRSAMGLFSQKREWFVAAAFLNILLDYLLVRPMGIAGLFLATIICRGITYIVDIHVTYRLGLKKNPHGYFRMLLKWLAFLVICAFLSHIMLRLVTHPGIIGFILRILLISVIYFALFLVTFSKSNEFQYYVVLVKKICFQLRRRCE